MLKRFCLCLIVCLFFLPAVTALADAIIDNDFYSRNQNETKRLNRSFCANGRNGFVSMISEPESGTEQFVIQNGNEVQIQWTYLYNDRYWGFTGIGHDVAIPGWVLMDELLLIYSHSDFIGEHLRELHTYTDNGGIRRILESEMQYIWRWPGSDYEKRQVYLAYVVENHFMDYLYNHSPLGEHNVYEYLYGNTDELPYSYQDYMSDYFYGNPGDYPQNYFDFLHEYHNYLYDNYFDDFYETNRQEISGESVDNAGEIIVRLFYEDYGAEHYHEFFDHFYENYIDYRYEKICGSFVARYAYMDDEGREWVYFEIEDGWGWRRYVDGWICIDDPANADISPFNPAPDPIRWSPTESPDWYGVREPLIDDNGDNTEYLNGENGEGNEFELSVPLIIVASLVFISAVVMVIYVFRNPRKME